MVGSQRLQHLQLFRELFFAGCSRHVSMNITKPIQRYVMAVVAAAAVAEGTVGG